MTSRELQSLASGAHMLRQAGQDVAADLIEIDISAELVGKFLEDEFDRNLKKHRERLKDCGPLPDWMDQ